VGRPVYVGRYAPSPTGPLHFGSLVAAVGSYLEARRQDGRWLLRIEDIDPPREMPGARDLILRALEAFGFQWDGPVVRQAERTERYEAAVQALLARGLAYPCGCSRAWLKARGHGRVYPGICRNGTAAHPAGHAIRVLTHDRPIAFTDRRCGPFSQRLEREVGDFVIRRRDGLYAYQLAVVVDDAAQGVTEVVRGEDLLASTPRQIHLQRLLGLPTPRYLHLPVVTDAEGNKLSKQTGAPPLDLNHPARALWEALAFLGHRPPPELREAPVDALWDWALVHWDPVRIPPPHGPVGRELTLPPVPGAGTPN
jgi:glutamyl-Q tRNA(Asp) synthetase